MDILISYPGFSELHPDKAVEWLTVALKTAKQVQRGARKLNAAIAQPVVHSLGKRKVVGSNPTRSSKKLDPQRLEGIGAMLTEPTRRSKKSKKSKGSKKWMEPMFDRT